MTTPGILIPNLPAFRAALKASATGTPQELTRAIEKAGVPIVNRAAALSPVRTGRLRASYRPLVQGNTGRITSSAPYGAGAEWGSHGKWSGFNRYGQPGARFATRALDETGDQVVAIITFQLNEIMTIHGWAK